MNINSEENMHCPKHGNENDIVLDVDIQRRLLAKKRVTVFLAAMFSFTAIVLVGMSLSDVFEALGFLALGWSPAAAAFLTILLTGGKLTDLGFRKSRPRFLLLSIGLAWFLVVIVYGTAWLTGLGGFYDPSFVANARDTFNITAVSPLGIIAISCGIYGTVGILFGSVLALGEEIGWRGLLVNELARFTSFTKTALISGGIWALWHFPVILFFGYHSKAPVWYGLACASTAMVLVSFPYAWLRLTSGSVWTVALLHGAHNVLFQEVFHPLTVDTGITEYVVGEFGALVILPVAFIVWLVYRNRDRIPNLASENKDLNPGFR
jgi:membrane protease YdiL (CAAX protease family)